MSGVAIAWYLLKTNGPVIAVIPAAKIKAGDLPMDSVLPAMSITQVSSTPRLTVAMTEAPRLHTDRIQVSWLFKSSEASPAGTGYPGIRAMDALVLAALPNTSGTVNGFAVDSILPDDGGPDLSDIAPGINQGSRDFIIKYRS